MGPCVSLRTPENNARQGFADGKQVEAICRHLSSDLADAVRFMFYTGWRSRSEVLPLRWGQVDFAGGFVRLEPGTTKNNEGRMASGTYFPPPVRLPADSGTACAPRAPAGHHAPVRAGADADHRARVSPVRQADQVHAAGLDDGVQEGGPPWAPSRTAPRTCCWGRWS
jgi:integrase